MKDLIIEFLHSHKDKLYSIGALAKRLDVNRITMAQHLRELAKRGEVESINAEILILRQETNGRVGEKLQDIKLYFIADGEEEEIEEGIVEEVKEVIKDKQEIEEEGSKEEGNEIEEVSG